MSKSRLAPFCPRYHHAVELIGRRWTGAIIRLLLPGSARFNALRAAVPDMSDRMLAERLRELEEEGVITRTVVPDVPVRVEYELTDKGRALEGVVVAIAKWAENWIADAGSETKAAGEKGEKTGVKNDVKRAVKKDVEKDLEKDVKRSAERGRRNERS